MMFYRGNGARRSTMRHHFAGSKIVVGLAAAAWLQAASMTKGIVIVNFCSARPVGTPCPDVDGNPCTQAQCDGFGSCIQNAHLNVGNICQAPAGTVCSIFRCGAAGDCSFSEFAAIGFPCPDTDGNECTEAYCESGTCTQDHFKHSVCTDTDGDPCTEAHCDGGFCKQNAVNLCSGECFDQAAGAPCTDTDGNLCTVAQCDGAGNCDQNAAFAFAFSGCEDTDGIACTVARCDGEGHCLQDYVNNCGECAGQPAGTSCTDTDGSVCTAARCDGLGGCVQLGGVHIGPCPDKDGDVCTDAQCDTAPNGLTFCNQNIVVLGRPCGDSDGNECTIAACDATGQCDQNFAVLVGNVCPDTDGNECTQARCDSSGNCDQRGLIVTGQSCTDTDGNECTVAVCNGSGNCDQNGLFLGDDDPCTDTDGNPCTEARCDFAGHCNQNGQFQHSGVTCPDTDGNDCTIAACNGFGKCDQNGIFLGDDDRCADTDGNPCTEARCDFAGHCNQNGQFQHSGVPCPDTDGNDCTIAACDGLGKCNQIANCEDDTPPDITCPRDTQVATEAGADPSITGEAFATDACDSSPDIDFVDEVVPATDPKNPIQEVIERTWTAKDACGNHDDCVQNISVARRVFSLDIKPGSCPNAYDPKANGLVPISLLGTSNFDVRTVNVSSLQLLRADGIGGVVKPSSSTLQDTGTPFGGALCGCHSRTGDGIRDLSLKFDNVKMATLLQLSSVSSGQPVTLVLSGTLSSGIAFTASDCIVRTAVRGK